MTATKDKITHEYDEKRFVFGYTLDVKTTPVAIDMTILEPQDLNGNEAKGIVKLADGKVTLCYHPTGGDRPKDFTSTKDNGNYLFVMKKKEAKTEEKK